MKIKIKHATTEGIKESEGTLFEAHGYQFCLMHDKEEGWFGAIELSTGCSVNVFDEDFYTRAIAMKRLKNDILQKSTDDYKRSIEQVKNTYCKQYNFSLPLNQPV
jgi:hypothetical protein